MGKVDEHAPAPELLNAFRFAACQFLVWGEFRSPAHHAQEEGHLERLIPLVDSSRSIQPVVGRFVGWPPVVERACAAILRLVDAIPEAWGPVWRDLTGPEPERSALEERLRARFREEVEQPAEQAALDLEAAWASHPRFVGPDDDVARWAEHARRRGCEATPRPVDEATTRWREARRRLLETPRFGPVYPDASTLGSRWSDARVATEALGAPLKAGGWLRHLLLPTPIDPATTIRSADPNGKPCPVSGRDGGHDAGRASASDPEAPTPSPAPKSPTRPKRDKSITSEIVRLREAKSKSFGAIAQILSDSTGEKWSYGRVATRYRRATKKCP